VHAFDAYLEVDEDGAEQGARVWVPQLPGLTVRGRNEGEAMARLEPSAKRYVGWLDRRTKRVLAGNWNRHFRLEEIHRDAGCSCLS